MKTPIAVFLTTLALGSSGAWAAEGTPDLGNYTLTQPDTRILMASRSGGGGGGGNKGARESWWSDSDRSSSKAAEIGQDRKPLNADMATLAAMVAQRHKQRNELYKQALDKLRANPALSDVPDCAAGKPQSSRDVCLRTDTLSKASLKAEPAATRKRIALLIANNAYTTDQNIPPLLTPISDVQAVASKLRNLSYDVRIVKDASKADFVQAINKLAGEVDRDDSVFVMYAGHGYLMDATQMGYWIPIDGKSTTPDNWISNKDISRFLSILPARQVILVSDSCFSGTLTKEQKIKDLKKLKRAEILRNRSVLALSSGADEPVSDEGSTAGHSVFAGHLLKAFDRLQDDVTGFELYRVLYSAVLQEFPQHPQYGAVVTAGHSGQGDYLLDVKTVKQ